MVYQYKVRGWLLGVESLAIRDVQMPVIGTGGEGDVPVPEAVLCPDNPVTTIRKVTVKVQGAHPNNDIEYHFFYAHSMHQGVNACIKAVVEQSQIQGPALLLRFRARQKRYADLTPEDWEIENSPPRIALKTVALDIQVRPDNDMNPQGRALGSSIIIVGEDGENPIGFN